MGGSNGGKHSKGKGTSTSRKNETSHKKIEVQNSKNNLAQTSNDKARGRRDSKGKRSKPQTPGGVNFTEKELEKHLLQRLDELYTGDDIKNSVMDGSHGSTSHSSNEGTTVPDLSSTTAKDGSTFINKQDLQNADSALPAIVGSNVEKCAESPKDALIVDLMETIKILKEKVKAQKEWAQKTVIDSANRLSKDLLELKTLRMEKEKTSYMKVGKLGDEMTCTLMLKETEQSLRSVICEASSTNNLIKTLELSNAHFRADTEALMLSASEYGNDLNQVIHREMRFTKRLASIGKQTSSLRAKGDEEKQKVLQLQLDVFQAEKEALEAEEKWKQEIKEKEQTLALLTEQNRMAGTRRAIQRAELARLCQQMETERKLKKDEVQRLEEEVTRLRVFMQTSNVLLEGDAFLYNGVEVTSLEPSAPYEHSRHWDCMLCCTNAVSVVFLSCAHQVVCAPCYEASCSSSVSGRCPYCGAEIQQSIKAFGPT